MGDMSKEPSMEEILSSIKRIIAEDAENAVSGRSRSDKGRPRRDSDREAHRKNVIANMVADGGDEPLSYVDEVLELTDEMPRVGKGTEMDHDVTPAPARSESAKAAPSASAPATEAPETIVSVESEVAARTSLAALSSLVVRSAEPGESNTLEGLVRDMLRPMLKEWLDSNLPTMVEGMVAREIARITGRPL